MAKKLTGTFGFVAALVAGLFIMTAGPKYSINGNKVKERRLTNTIVEYKGPDRVRYTPDKRVFPDGPITVFVNGKGYTQKDTAIYTEAVKRYNYLRGQIDSIKTAEKESKLIEKLDEKKKEEDKALWVIRK